MPVLDAKALKTDPKGMAFLLSVLRPAPLRQTPVKEVRKLDELEARALRQRDRLLQDII